MFKYIFETILKGNFCRVGIYYIYYNIFALFVKYFKEFFMDFEINSSPIYTEK